MRRMVFPVQIIYKHGVMYVTSELKKIACFTPSPPTTTITTTAQMLDFYFLEVQKVAYEHRGESKAVLPDNIGWKFLEITRESMKPPPRHKLSRLGPTKNKVKPNRTR